MRKSTKLVIFFGFLLMFFGSAWFMYIKFIHERPKIKIVAPKTDIDPIKFDSLLRVQQEKLKSGYKKD